MLLRGRLYVGPLEQLRDTEPLPFHLVPRQSTFVLTADKPTTVRYEAAGASRYRLSSRNYGDCRKTLRGKIPNRSVHARRRGLPGKAVEGLAENLKNGRQLTDNRRRAEAYAGPSRAAFRRLFGREAKGVPLPIDIQVTAEGNDFETAELRHDFLIEVSLRQLEDALDKKYPALRDPWQKPSEQFNLADYPKSATPPTLQDTMSSYLRDLWETPHPPVTGKQLREAARIAKAKGAERLHGRFSMWTKDQQWRTWTDAEVRKTEGLLRRYFAGQVTLQLRKDLELTFDDSNVSQADREYLLNRKEAVIPNDSDLWRECAVDQCLQAVVQFDRTNLSLPPQALTDETGQPRLSWRTLLLRELGYGEMFELFRLDEPWNSEHNRELIPFMPHVLALDVPKIADGKTTLMTVFGHLSAIRTTGTLKIRDLGREAISTDVFVEADSSRATEWTKPVDLHFHELADASSVVRVRSKTILIGLLDGPAIQIPADTSRDDWRFAVNLGDRRRLFEPPTK